MDINIFLGLAVLLLFAKLFGELAQKLKMPALLGEILTGIILGPAVLKIINPDMTFKLFAEIGIILLIFLAGFEHGSIKELLKYKNTSISISVLSSTLPVIAVIILTQMQGFSLLTSLFLATALGATSMGVSLASLMGVKELDTKVGKTVMGSLVLNDITGLLLLTGVVTYADVVLSGAGNIFLSLGKSFASILICFTVFYLGFKYMPRISNSFIKFKVQEAQFTFAIVLILLFAWLAASFGLSLIIGAFIAGIMIARSPVFETDSFHKKIHSIAYGFFIPIFFVMTGTLLEFTNFASNISRALLFFGVIITIQVGGAFTVAKLFKYDTRESLITGLAMLPYGEVTLVVMSALMILVSDNSNFFVNEDISGLFSSVLILILLTVVMTPILMKLVNYIFKNNKKSKYSNSKKTPKKDTKR
jgi:Kef-type K+ transport system membrane component KefB